MAAQSRLAVNTVGTAAIIDANRNMARLVSQIALPKSVIFEALSTQTALGDMVASAGLERSLLASFAKLDTSCMMAASLAAQEKMQLLEGYRVGQLLGADTTFRRSIGAHLGIVTRRYSDLMSATVQQDAPSRDTALVTAFPPLDYYRHLDVLESITVSPDEARASSETVRSAIEGGAPTIDDRLLLFDVTLHPLLLGARASVDSGNPDSPRHAMTSLRELMTQVLHRLAPDDEVRLWSTDREHYREGRPTRRARLLFICRDINSGPLVDFVKADVSAGIALVDLLNGSTHVVRSQLTPDQLRSVVARVESLLLFLLSLRGV